MTMKEICIDCLCLQLYEIRENAGNPAKVKELVAELLAEYDDIAPLVDGGESPAQQDLFKP